MAVTFSRTLRSLETDRARLWVLELGGVLILATWLGWFLFGHVTVYEATEKARLEVEEAAHAVASPVAGQVVQSSLMIGRMVQQGETLLVLDTETERRALREKQVRCETQRARLKALRGEIAAEQQALAALQKAREAAVAEAGSQTTEAEAKARFASHQAIRAQRLQSSAAISPEEYDRQQMEATASRACVQTLVKGAQRLELDRAAQESDRQARLAKLEREAVELTGEIQVEEATIRRLDHDVELRTVRAPVSGRVGSVAELRAGSVIQAAEKLGTIIPAGDPRIVALYPASAVGRIRSGQSAQLRLESFPWTQYGTLKANVKDVGNEAVGGFIRVELALAATQDAAIQPEHGLSGSAEIAVEKVSPAVLVLRAAGQFLSNRAEPASPETGQNSAIALAR
jgi:multidrug resistance efflux pump